ncbi:MAG: Asp23/Gls24 family envelope stress response protein [Clostridiales Family XIII bacterium]|jgi:hypothetical protein|nr:Asp23/Gls24 family envelope stress response protein [Clostridiales Family XIII bacterium]
MKIYSLVGKSGTGKSYQAGELCSRYGIDSIIDDGLFIVKGQILAGVSAKRQNTKIRAIKTALFTDDDHMKSVAAQIGKTNPDSMLVVGTSDKMIGIITDRLGLPRPDTKFDIEDITTAEERASAWKQRHELGKHVIPAPTVQIRKDFSGYFYHPIRTLRGMADFGRGREKSDEADGGMNVDSRSGMTGLGDGSGRADYGGGSGKAAHGDRSDKAGHGGESGKADYGGGSGKAGYDGGSGKAAHGDRSGKAGYGDGSGKADKSGKAGHGGGSAKSAQWDRSVVRPTYSYLGEFTISDKAIRDIIRSIGGTINEIEEVPLILVHTHREGAVIELGIVVRYGQQIVEAARSLQQMAVARIEEMTSLNVIAVDVEIQRLAW